MGLMDRVREVPGNEENTDKVLDKAEQLDRDGFGEDKADQIKKVRDMAGECLDDKK